MCKSRKTFFKPWVISQKMRQRFFKVRDRLKEWSKNYDMRNDEVSKIVLDHFEETFDFEGTEYDKFN